MILDDDELAEKIKKQAEIEASSGGKRVAGVQSKEVGEVLIVEGAGEVVAR